MVRSPYPTDLTERRGRRLAPHIPPASPGGRPRRVEVRAVVNGSLDVLRNGIVWRALPHDLVPWQTAYDDARRWRLDGTWARLNDALRERERVRQGRAAQPTGAVLDSQRAKTSEKGGLAAGTGPKS